MKKILAAIILATFTVAAYAQTGTVNSKANLATEINTDLPNNTTGAITPAILRQVLQDILASLQQYGTVPTGGGTATQQTVTLIATPQAGQVFAFVPTASNLGTETYLTANGATPIVVISSYPIPYYFSGYNLQASMLHAGTTAVLWYDGTDYILLNPQLGWNNQFYLATPTGIDQGTCQDSNFPCRTIQYAGNVALGINTGGAPAYINFGTGEWNNDVANFKSCPPGWANNNDNHACIILNGFGATQTIIGCTANCFGGTIVANQQAVVGVQNMAVTASATDGSNFADLYANLGGRIEVYGGVTLGHSNFTQFYVEDVGSAIDLWNTPTINGTAQYFVYATLGGQFFETGATAVTLIATPTYTQEVFFATDLGSIFLGAPFNGTGITNGAKRYLIEMNSVLDTDGIGCTNLPGSVAGTLATGGVCN